MTTDHGPQRQPEMFKIVDYQLRCDKCGLVNQIVYRYPSGENLCMDCAAIVPSAITDFDDSIPDMLYAEIEKFRTGEEANRELIQSFADAAAELRTEIARLRQRLQEAIDFVREFVDTPEGYFTDGVVRKDAQIWLDEMAKESQS